MIVLNQYPVSAVAQMHAQNGAIVASYKCGKVPHYYTEPVALTRERYAIHTTINAIENHVKHCTDCWVRLAETYGVHLVLRPKENENENDKE